MKGEDNKRYGAMISADLRTKKRREGEALLAFERLIDRPVPSPRAAKTRKRKYDRLRPYEEVLWEAPDQ